MVRPGQTASSSTTGARPRSAPVVQHQQQALLARTQPIDEGSPLPSRTPNAWAIVGARGPGRARAARPTKHTPSGNVAAISAATASASRVLPTPPGPVRVTSGTSGRSSRSRDGGDLVLPADQRRQRPREARGRSVRLFGSGISRGGSVRVVKAEAPDVCAAPDSARGPPARSDRRRRACRGQDRRGRWRGGSSAR